MRIFRLRLAVALLAAALALGTALVRPARAGEFHEVYRGARAQAMGGAFVGLADDEEAIWLNPAGLAGNTKYTFHYAVADLGISTDLLSSYQSGANAFKNLSGDSLNVIIGKNVYSQAQVTPTLMMPNFGISLMMDAQAALLSQNKALPRIDVGYQSTNGVQAAWGFSLNRGLRSRGELRFGLGAKLMWRRGGYHILPLMDVLTISRETLSRISGNFGRGIGMDLGTQYLFRPNPRLTLSAGLAFTDIGDTTFAAAEANPIKGDLAWGLAGVYTVGRTKVTLSYEYRHVLDATDWRKKNHYGLEIGMPFVSLYGGINQVYFTYGFAFDAWLFRLTALSYAEEQGSFVFQDPERRYVLKIALKFDL